MFTRISIAFVLVLAAVFGLATMSPSAQAQTVPTPTPTATPSPACQGASTFGVATAGTVLTQNQYTFNGISQNVSEVCVKLASGATSGQIRANGPILNCWSVSDIGTRTVTLKRTSSAASCDTNMLFAVLVNPPAATPVPTATATPAPTASATPVPAAGTGTLVGNGRLPATGYGLIVFGGGAYAQLVAVACTGQGVIPAFWIPSSGGGFTSYSAPATGVPANLALLGRCR